VPALEEATSRPDCPVALNRLLFTRAIADREPTAPATRFVANGEPVYVFMEIANPTGPEGTVRIEWAAPSGNNPAAQTMEVGVSPTWRTWVRHRVGGSELGEWSVTVSHAGSSCELGRGSFTAYGAAESGD